jgi:thioredoxin 1
MLLPPAYADAEPKRAEVDALPGATVLEFGNNWCGWCRRAQPLIAEAFAGHPALRHLKIADASGKRLGRSFGVKLWPTLIFLKDGQETARLVRPMSVDEIRMALAQALPLAPGRGAGGEGEDLQVWHALRPCARMSPQRTASKDHPPHPLPLAPGRGETAPQIRPKRAVSCVFAPV